MQHLLLQYALNQLIEHQNLDVNTLEGATIHFVVQDLPVADSQTYFICTNQRFFVVSETNSAVGATIKLKPDTLVALFKGEDLTELLRQDKISIHGGVKIAQLLVDLLKQIDIDLEETLSHYTGDIVAHQAGKLLKTLQYELHGSNNPIETAKDKLAKLLIRPSVHQ